MRCLLPIVLITLAGCGAPAPYRAAQAAGPLQQALNDCDFEATKATANIRNGLEAGFMQGTIKRQGMQAKGFTQ